MARDLTKGSIPGHVAALAIPAIFSMLAVVANNFIDTALVGHLGDAELAAVGSSAFIIWLIFSLLDVFSVGAQAVISQEFGAGNLANASRYSESIFSFAILFSIGLAILGIGFSGRLFDNLNLAPHVETMGEQYLMIVFFAIPCMLFNEVISAIFRAIGDTRTPMKIMLMAVGLNIVLDILLIYGIWIFPRLETAGAAIATATAHTAGSVLAWRAVKKGKIPFKIFPENFFNIDFRIVRRMIRIGLPIGISNINFSLVYLVMTRIMSEFGTVAVASIPVGNRAESFSYMICFGFYIAVSALVGQNIGANNPARVTRSVWTTVGFTSIATSLFGVTFALFSSNLASIMTGETEVIKIASYYLRILAISQIFMGLEFVFEGAFSGAGNTVPHMTVSIPGTLIRIPLSYYLAITVGLGPVGIFWAITISTIVKGTSILIWFRFARWRKVL